MRILIIILVFLFGLFINVSTVYGQKWNVDLRIRIIGLKDGDYIKSNGFITFNYSVFNKGSDKIFKYDSLYIDGKIYDSIIKPYPLIIPLQKDINVNDSIIMSFTYPYSSPKDYNYFYISLNALPLNRSVNGIILENLEQQKDNRISLNNLKYRSPTSSISNIDWDQSSIYPNPASDLVYIKFEDELKNIKIGISDINGQLIKEYYFYSNKSLISINTSDFNNGVYFITIADNNTPICSKLIVLH